MKTKITALVLITATALSLAPKPAAASDKGLAIVGGFIGGLIVASAINDSRHDNYYAASNTAVIADDRCDVRAPNGFWKEVSIRVWVPGCWVVERSYHGRGYRRYVEGHYDCRNDRVWVSTDRHDRRDREVSYGYGNRR
jgi:hypothetical protein